MSRRFYWVTRIISRCLFGDYTITVVLDRNVFHFKSLNIRYILVYATLPNYSIIYYFRKSVQFTQGRFHYSISVRKQCSFYNNEIISLDCSYLISNTRFTISYQSNVICALWDEFWAIKIKYSYFLLLHFNSMFSYLIHLNIFQFIKKFIKNLHYNNFT